MLPKAITLNRILDDEVLLAMFWLIDAGLVRKQEAIVERLRALELRPISNDAVDGATVIGNLAMIYASVGEVNSAMERLVFLAKTPGGTGYCQLKFNSAWDGWAVTALRKNRLRVTGKSQRRVHYSVEILSGRPLADLMS